MLQYKQADNRSNGDATQAGDARVMSVANDAHLPASEHGALNLRVLGLRSFHASVGPDLFEGVDLADAIRGSQQQLIQVLCL